MSQAEVPPPKPLPATTPPELGAQLAALTERLRHLEARVATLEMASPAALSSLTPTPLETPALEFQHSPVHLVGLVGRVCLILGGATFIRALVDASTIHRGWGVALGLGYALAWTFLALRVKAALEAGFYALASILITYPLIVESTARFDILPPTLAATLLLAVTALHTTVAWRRDLLAILWTATLASLASGLILMGACHTIEPFLTVLLLLGVGSLWLTYGRRWHGLRWPTALAANLGVLVFTSLAAWPGGPPEAYRNLSATRAMGFALTLAALYLGSFALRMLQRRRVLNPFEWVQTALVLLVGFGGAVRVALASGSGLALLGGGVSLVGLGCYAAALPFAADQEETRANFNFFTSLALVLLLLGGLVVLQPMGFSALSGGLGIATMLVGLRLRRAILTLHSGLFLLAGALVSDLAGGAFRAFFAPSGPTAALPLAGLLSLAALTATVLLVILRPTDAGAPFRGRAVILLLGALAAAGWGALAIHACRDVFHAGTQDPGAVAAIRTGVLATLAITLAWLGGARPTLGLRWLVHPILILIALKFLLEDVTTGRPLTLFLALMCFGLALMLAPRLLKRSPDPKDLAPRGEHP